MHYGKDFVELVEAALENGVADHGCLLWRALAHGMNQRQRGLALCQIVADIFPQLASIAGVIQNIINQLESDTQMAAVGGQLVPQSLLLVAEGKNRTGFCR